MTLREQRRRAGLSLAAVARAAGTSESNVSAYELGRKRLRGETRARLEAAIACGASSPIHTYGLLTAPATAAALRRGLRDGWPTADLLRVPREFRANHRHLSSPADRAAAVARPSTTGDQRWDVLLAGVVEDLSLRAGDSAPAWTQSSTLSEFWFVSSAPTLEALAFANTCPSLLLRGVVLDDSELTAV